MSGTGTIRVPDLPDLGAVTDDTSLVAEHSGTGRVVATALRDYMTLSGGGPYLPLSGGTLTGSLTTSAAADITSGHDAYVSGALHIGSTDGFMWSHYVDGSGARIEAYGANQSDVYDASGNRGWYGTAGSLMSLSAGGDFWVRNSVVSPTIHSTGNLFVDGTIQAAAINAPSAPMTTGAITATTINASGGITTSGDINASNVNVTGQVSFGGGYRMLISGGNREIFFSSNWRLSWEGAQGNFSYIRDDNSIAMTSFGSSSDFFIGGANAYKTGGGSWASPSDSRIKTVVGDYTRGLAEILQLQPKRFTYRGNDTISEPGEGRSAPYSGSPNYIAAKDGTEFAGLVAQELQPVFPEMTREYTGYIDGVVKSDMLHVDRSSLDLALVNAVKELEARIAALESLMAPKTAP